jgi:hypothetical protein
MSIATSRRSIALRVAGWVAASILISIAFHYAKKYEAGMLTDTGSEFNCSIANGVVCK